MVFLPFLFEMINNVLFFSAKKKKKTKNSSTRVKNNVYMQ